MHARDDEQPPVSARTIAVPDARAMTAQRFSRAIRTAFGRQNFHALRAS